MNASGKVCWEMARRMVCEWGMSELGPLSFGSKDEPVFLGRDFNQRADYSEDTAIRIDREVDRIVQTAYESARKILTDNRAVLERLAQELLEHESLDGTEVYATIEEMTGKDLLPTLPKAKSLEAQPEDVASAPQSETLEEVEIEDLPDEVLDATAEQDSPSSSPRPAAE